MINQWKKLDFYDPKEILIGLLNIAKNIPLSNLLYQQASLRSRDLKQYGESRQCALFCYGMSKFLNQKIFYAQYEASDYDYVACRKIGDVIHYTPIQLKEFVPEKVNPKSSLENELIKLEKYKDSKDLIIAMFINRAGRIEMNEIKIPKLNVAELWFFGAASEDQRTWFLYGDVLNNTLRFDFKYPKS